MPGVCLGGVGAGTERSLERVGMIECGRGTTASQQVLASLIFQHLYILSIVFVVNGLFRLLSELFTPWHQPGVKAVARSLTNKEGEPLAFTTTKGISMLTADVTVPSSLPAVING